MTTNKLLRHINAVRSLRLLARGQVMSRAEIARELGLTRATVGYAIAVLTDARLAVEAAEQGSDRRKGRPGIGVGLDPKGAYFLGVDIGTKVLTTVLVDLTMAVVARRVEPTGANFRTPSIVAARIVPAALAVLAEAGIAGDRVEGLGISVPGLVGRDGRVVNAPFLEWRNFRLRETVVGACPEGWSVVVVNDAFAFANAETAMGAAIGSESLFLLLLAEGIGGATIDAGRVFSGANGYAGEVGHTVVAVNGRSGAFETLAGAKAFADLLPADRPVVDGVAALLARQHDGDVARALDNWADALAVGMANIIHMLDPGRILLGGPVAALYPTREAVIGRLLGERLLPGMVVPTVAVTTLGADGPAIGAAATIREQMFALPELDAPSQEPTKLTRDLA